MKEIILLGAGASVEAGVPAAYEMTEKFIEQFEEHTKYCHIIRFVVGGLLMQKGVRGENPFAGVNIEDVFNAIELLANRENLEASAFIGSWHRLVDELDLIRPPQFREGESVNRYLLARQYSNQSNRQKLRSPTESRPGEGKTYEDVNEAMIRGLIKMVWVEDRQKVEYLMPILKAQTNLTIATLNYDNTVELAGKSSGMQIQTGIEEWSKSGSFPKIDDGICLLKLHGSIDWMPQPITSPLSQQAIRVLPLDQMEKNGFFKPEVIFGRRNKLTAKGPFLELLRAFEEKLKEADRLTIIGYSFRDEHINEQIRKWIINPNRLIRIINKDCFSSTDIKFARSLVGIKERVEVLSMCAKDGISKCFA
jgi:NAD-dependent SIR2 family protein deacetylase